MTRKEVEYYTFRHDNVALTIVGGTHGKHCRHSQLAWIGWRSKTWCEAFEKVKQQDQVRRQHIPKGIPVWRSRKYSLDGNPAIVDGSPVLRMSELPWRIDKTWLVRSGVSSVQSDSYLGWTTKWKWNSHSSVRLLVLSIYNKVWMQRFIRDSFRYKDEWQCAAARIVQALHNIARLVSDSTFDTKRAYSTRWFSVLGHVDFCADHLPAPHAQHDSRWSNWLYCHRRRRRQDHLWAVAKAL